MNTLQVTMIIGKSLSPIYFDHTCHEYYWYPVSQAFFLGAGCGFFFFCKPQPQVVATKNHKHRIVGNKNLPMGKLFSSHAGRFLVVMREAF